MVFKSKGAPRAIYTEDKKYRRALTIAVDTKMRETMAKPIYNDNIPARVAISPFEAVRRSGKHDVRDTQTASLEAMALPFHRSNLARRNTNRSQRSAT